MKNFRSVCAAILLLAVCCVPTSVEADAPDFEKAIAPLLIKRCVECHQGNDPSGGLNLTDEKSFRKGGDSGAVYNAKSAGKSHLIQRVLDGEMPPEKQGRSQKLPDAEAQLLLRWLAI